MFVAGSLPLLGDNIPDSAGSHDLTAVAMEVKSAKGAAFSTWDLPVIKNQFAIALRDLEAFRVSHPHFEDDALAATVHDLEADLQIVSWEIRGESTKNPADPHGLFYVSTQLERLLKAAQADESRGKSQAALVKMDSCWRSWLEIQNLHPSWEKAMVWQRIQECTAILSRLEHPKAYRQIDLHTSI